MQDRNGEDIPGRTDALGCWNIRWDEPEESNINTYDDIDIVYTVGACLRHLQYGGLLEDIGREYIERHCKILNAYGLIDVLEADWVFLREKDAYTTSNEDNRAHFEQAVKPCMNTHFEV